MFTRATVAAAAVAAASAFAPAPAGINGQVILPVVSTHTCSSGCCAPEACSPLWMTRLLVAVSLLMVCRGGGSTLPFVVFSGLRGNGNLLGALVDGDSTSRRALRCLDRGDYASLAPVADQRPAEGDRVTAFAAGAEVLSLLWVYQQPQRPQLAFDGREGDTRQARSCIHCSHDFLSTSSARHSMRSCAIISTTLPKLTRDTNCRC